MTEQQALQKMKKDIQLRRLSASTFKNYKRNVKKFFAYCERPIEDLNENDVRRFIEHLMLCVNTGGYIALTVPKDGCFPV